MPLQHPHLRLLPVETHRASERRAEAPAALPGLPRAPESAPRPLRDEVVSRAIALLAGQLAKTWTVSSLARSVGLSRPVLARRFQACVGMSPMRYLAARRMERAAELLAESDAGLAQVADCVGYRSEFAFNRAFKRHHHCAPGAFRRELRLPHASNTRLSAQPEAFRAAA